MRRQNVFEDCRSVRKGRLENAEGPSDPKEEKNVSSNEVLRVRAFEEC